MPTGDMPGRSREFCRNSGQPVPPETTVLKKFEELAKA